MTAVALDTLRISKRLREAGFSEPQAEAVTGVLHDAQEVALGDLATKADMRDIRAEMREVKAEVGALRTDLKAELATLRSESKADTAALRAEVSILKWAMGIIVAGVVALVMKAFFLG